MSSISATISFIEVGLVGLFFIAARLRTIEQKVEKLKRAMPTAHADDDIFDNVDNLVIMMQLSRRRSNSKLHGGLVYLITLGMENLKY